ncbi:hypothetical protein ACFOQM_15650 [Paenibacillus sp. GCM10012307]|uniref:Uncharacterized protein n=1 Tax=Paenibacillus roseus TaxID=2798579 RepID=A0A934MLX2_9BACL|nr:hypothetical protein [Paenibacillus roseus]MBJ6362680.1 hypothetical protein [Paenibacillus roseus]
MTSKHIAQRWIDDHLDLYNYAVEIGDKAWQEEILFTLKQKELHIYGLIRSTIRTKLWQKFDQINQELLALYGQLHGLKDEGNQGSQYIKEKLWDLKLERLQVAQQLRGL